MDIAEMIQATFTQLAAGELRDSDSLIQEGWEMTLPSGKAVTRSTLQEEAAALIDVGPEAVPHLLAYVLQDNAALRYVAVYALEQITGQKAYRPYFDAVEAKGKRARAVKVWKKWYEARTKI